MTLQKKLTVVATIVEHDNGTYSMCNVAIGLNNIINQIPDNYFPARVNEHQLRGMMIGLVASSTAGIVHGVWTPGQKQ